MRNPTQRLSDRLRANQEELERRLSQRQSFPLVSDGPESRKVLAEIAAFEEAVEEKEYLDPKTVARRRLKQWRSLVASRYKEWRAANAS